MLELILPSLIYGLIISSIYIITSVGKNVSSGVLRIINFGHGDFMTIGMYIAYSFFILFSVSPLISALLAFVILFIAGFPIVKIVVNRFTKGAPMLHVLMTYAIGVIIRNSLLASWGGWFRGIEVNYDALTFYFLGVVIDGKWTVTFIISVVVAFLAYLFFMKTKLGMSIRAVTQNPEAAVSIGINNEKVRAIGFSLSLALAGISGALLGILYPIYPYAGMGYTLKAIIICVLGSLGDFLGAVCGALILGIAESLSILIVPYGLRDMVGLILFVIILLLKPNGLLGRGEVVGI